MTKKKREKRREKQKKQTRPPTFRRPLPRLLKLRSLVPPPLRQAREVSLLPRRLLLLPCYRGTQPERLRGIEV